MNADNFTFIKCQCEGEGMGIDYDGKDDLYYFSYWSQGLSNNRLSWAQRLRYCWKTLKTGKAFNDELLFTSKDANRLCNWIISCESNKLLDKETSPYQQEFS